MEGDYPFNFTGKNVSDYGNFTSGYTHQEIHSLAIAAIISAIISFIACLVCLIATILHFYHAKKLSAFHLIVAIISLSDFILSCSIIGTTSEILRDMFPLPFSNCAAGGFFVQLGVSGSLVFSMLFSTQLCLTVFFAGREQEDFITDHIHPISIVLGLLCMVIAFIPLLPSAHGYPDQARFATFGITGAWCWIEKQWLGARYVLLYAWVFFVCAWCLVTAVALIGYAWKTAHLSKQKKLKLFSLLLFPLAIILVWLPGMALRGIQGSGGKAPFWLALTQSVVLPLEGFFNTLLYFVNRRALYQVSPIKWTSKSTSTSKRTPKSTSSIKTKSQAGYSKVDETV